MRRVSFWENHRVVTTYTFPVADVNTNPFTRTGHQRGPGPLTGIIAGVMASLSLGSSLLPFETHSVALFSGTHSVSRTSHRRR